MAKYLFYRMTHDSGFAPNPFWNYCTLATCTPNHQRARLEKGDFIIGVEGKGLAHKRKQKGYKTDIDHSLVFVMEEIEDPLDLDSYFQDTRFRLKKMKKGGDWRKKRGDNVYYKENDEFKWIRGHFHDNENQKLKFVKSSEIQKEFKKLKNEKGYGLIAQDLRGNSVFVSKKFMYFGDLCIPFGQRFFPLLKKGPSFKYGYDGDRVLEEFKTLLKQLKRKYGYGQHGTPINRSLKKHFGKKSAETSSCGKK